MELHRAEVWKGEEVDGELKDPVVFCMQAEHPGTRTYYFSADSNEDQTEWIRAMSRASEVTDPLPERTDPADVDPSMVTREPEETQPCRETRKDDPDKQDVNPSPPSTPSSDHNHRRREPHEQQERGAGAGHDPHSIKRPNGLSSSCSPETDNYRTNSDRSTLSRSQSLRPDRPTDGRAKASYQSQGPVGPVGPVDPVHPVEPVQPVVMRRPAQPAPEKLAQRKSSMAQLQQWVNQRRGMASQEDIRSPSRYYSMSRDLSSDYYSYPGGPQFLEEFSLYPPGLRPDSICSSSAVGGFGGSWAMEEKRRSLRDGLYQLYKPPSSRDSWGPQYYAGMERMEASMRRLSIQPRSRSVPRSPSSSSGGPYSPVPPSFTSPARSPSARFDRYPGRFRDDAIYADPSVYSLRRSLSSPKVPPFHDIYSRELHPTLKLNEIETSKLLGRLCEQMRTLRDQEGLVHRLRMNKDSLEEALMSTHQQMALYQQQPGVVEQLQLRKESQQKQLVNTRGELSQASSALTTTRMEFEALEDEANAIHGDLWEQLNAGGQSELVRRHIQKEFWRVQDVLEGLHKSSLSRGTDTAKHRVASGASGSFSTTSSASPLSSVSLTSPLSPYSSVPGCQPSPSKQLGMEPTYGEQSNTTDLQDLQDRLSVVNKVGVVTPRTKSPTDELHRGSAGLSPLNGRVTNGLSRERPKSAVFPAEIKSKMSVQEQNERIRRNQSNSLREKRRSLNLSGAQSPANYKVVRRRLTAHEIDIKDLEAAVRGTGQESPQEEIARLRRLQMDPDDANNSREMISPDGTLIPERHLDLEDHVPLSPEEQKEKQKKLERIKTLIAKSNLQNVVPVLDGPVEGNSGLSCQQQLQEQEKRIEISCALAAEASRRSRMLSAQCSSPPLSPSSQTQSTSADFSSSAHIVQIEQV